jgi:hypothetical protein
MQTLIDSLQRLLQRWGNPPTDLANPVLDELVALRVLSRVIGMGFGLIVLYALHDWSNFMGIFTVNSLADRFSLWHSAHGAK